MNTSISPSRRYVAMCSKLGFNGYYFRKFTLPECIKTNNSDHASWYFLNRLNYDAAIQGCITLEDFENISEEEVIEYASE